MNFKLNSALLILLICFACLTISHGHSHDGLNGHHHSHDHHDHHHHGHSHEDTKPSFKYTREANEEIKRQANEHSHQHNEPHHHEEQKAPKRAVPLNTFDLWLHSLGSTLLISAAPFLILYLVPLDNTEQMQPRLKTLLAFASGGLLGDAFLHLIPHSVTPHNHDSHSHSHGVHSHEEEDSEHSHSHDMWVGLWVLAGIIAFLTVEKIVRILKIGHDHGHSHGGSKDHEPENQEVKKSDSKDQLKKTEKGQKSTKKKASEKHQPSMEVAGYLNLAADFTHNFTDGLAIGASYLAGNSIGIVTTITILLHEVPHEIGDFAILIKSGCSKKKAMMLQLTTAVGALAGNVLALLGTSETSSPWILPFTAGGFIYIATVSVLPELLEHSTKLGQSLKEICALLVGVLMMVLITQLE